MDDPDELVVQVMKKYDLVALPVVDDHNRLLGRITIDDVVDLMEEEAEKDYQLASGLSDEVESDDSLWEMTRARLPWLLIGLFGGLAGAYVIGAFDIERFPSMALFIPLIAAMGGNVGVQSAAIVVQGLAGGRTPSARLAPRLLKELSVALLNGAICALVILGASLVLGYGWNLSVTVSLALIAVIVFAALFGTFVPLTLDRFKIDPALATGPFITTANDIIGLIIYFGIGVLMAADAPHRGLFLGGPPPRPPTQRGGHGLCRRHGRPPSEGVRQHPDAAGIVLRSRIRVDADLLDLARPPLHLPVRGRSGKHRRGPGRDAGHPCLQQPGRQP